MKRIGDPTTLTRLSWFGEEPEPGDVLRTRTGRQYLILEVRGRRLFCCVVGPDHVIEGKLFKWEWARR